MPKYELSVIFKCLQRPEIADAVKRAALAIADKGGILRSFENIGERKLPYNMSKHGEKHSTGMYLLVKFDGPGEMVEPLQEELHRDLDVLRPRILRQEVETSRPCLHGPCDFGEQDEEKRRRLKDNLLTYVQKQ